MTFRRIIVLFFLLFFFSPSAVWGQITTVPDDETPWGNKARGFVEAHLGFSYIPVIDIEVTHMDSDVFYNRNWDIRTKPPGIAAGIGFIPAFGYNGILAEVSYTLNGVEFRSEVDNNNVITRGKTTFGLSMVDINAGYVRYFLDDPWHIYLGAMIGLETVIVKSTTDFEGESSVTTQRQVYNGATAGSFGFYRKATTGGIGAELRVSYSFVNSTIDMRDPFGSVEYDIFHPLMIKLMAVFLLGGL